MLLPTFERWLFLVPWALFIVFLVLAPPFLPALIWGLTEDTVRCNGNEKACLEVLRNLAVDQNRFRRRRVLDRDHDGIGEFGHLRELGGDPDEISRTTAYLASCGLWSRGVVGRCGYCFVVYLPGVEGWTAERTADLLDTEDKIDAREKTWVGLAFPEVAGKSGRRIFRVDPSGLYQCDEPGFLEHWPCDQVPGHAQVFKSERVWTPVK